MSEMFLTGGPASLRSALRVDLQSTHRVVEGGLDSTEWGRSAPACAVMIYGGDGPFVPALITRMSEGEWVEVAEVPLLRFMEHLQAAYRALQTGGGSVVAVVPSCGLTGAPELSALVTSVEGVRAMAKSAARQWGEHAITVNSVAVPVSLWDDHASEKLSFLHPAPVVTDTPRLVKALAGVIRMFTSPEAAAISGATVVVDGGRVMLP